MRCFNIVNMHTVIAPVEQAITAIVIQHFTEDTAANAAISTNSIVTLHFWQQMHTA